MRNFAARLVALEMSANKSSEAGTSTPFSVIEKLRPGLARLMGNGGFHALLSRALRLASAKTPSLRTLEVQADGSLKDLQKQANQDNGAELHEIALALTAELLGLLTAFIGENLTLQLAREIWPKISLTDSDFGSGAKHE